jgi:hypothetical protein
MKRNHWMQACLLAAIVTTACQAGTFFVNGDEGSDLNSGISDATPFQTIQRAIDEAVDLPGPDTIHIAAGQYEENLAIADLARLTMSGSGATVTATDSAQAVIAIYAGDITISGLTISGGELGIDAVGTPEVPVRLSLRDVEISGNADDGVAAENILSLTINQGMFIENGGDGVKVVAVESVSITGTTVLDNDSDGVDLEEINTINLNGLIVIGNGDEGLEVDASVSINVLQGIYSENTDEGLDIDTTETVRVLGVSCNGNGGNGIQIEAQEGMNVKSAQIINSSFLANNEDGVNVVEDGATVETLSLTSVTARENLQSGLDISISGTVTAHAVNTEGNGEPDIMP